MKTFTYILYNSSILFKMKKKLIISLLVLTVIILAYIAIMIIIPIIFFPHAGGFTGAGCPVGYLAPDFSKFTFPDQSLTCYPNIPPYSFLDGYNLVKTSY